MSEDPLAAAAPTTPERTLRGEERRAALLSAVERLVRERPLAAIGVGDVAREARVTRSAFYFYFPSKGAAVAELLWGVFDEMAVAVAGFLRAADEDPSTFDPGAACRAALGRTYDLWRAHRPLLLAMLDAGPSEPDVRVLWEGWIEAFAVRVAEAVEAQRAAGLAPPGTPALPLARVLVGANERAMERLARSAAGDDEAAAVLDALAVTWVGALHGGAA